MTAAKTKRARAEAEMILAFALDVADRGMPMAQSLLIRRGVSRLGDDGSVAAVREQAFFVMDAILIVRPDLFDGILVPAFRWWSGASPDVVATTERFAPELEALADAEVTIYRVGVGPVGDDDIRDACAGQEPS